MHDQSYGDAPTKGETQAIPRDEEFGKGAQSMLNEAAERVTFHQIELERWRRIGRASASAVRELNMSAPVPRTTADDFFTEQADGGVPAQDPRF
jgi:hypothetical protein